MEGQPIEAIITEIENETGSHSTRLNSLEAANYLNKELLQQIDILRTDNEQVISKISRIVAFNLLRIRNSPFFSIILWIVAEKISVS